MPTIISRSVFRIVLAGIMLCMATIAITQPTGKWKGIITREEDTSIGRVYTLTLFLNDSGGRFKFVVPNYDKRGVVRSSDYGGSLTLLSKNGNLFVYRENLVFGRRCNPALNMQIEMVNDSVMNWKETDSSANIVAKATVVHTTHIRASKGITESKEDYERVFDKFVQFYNNQQADSLSRIMSGKINIASYMKYELDNFKNSGRIKSYRYKGPDDAFNVDNERYSVTFEVMYANGNGSYSTVFLVLDELNKIKDVNDYRTGAGAK